MIAELSNRFLRATSLVVTDRRWGATLSATALGFGLFVGVAIGPGAAGTLATGAQQIIEIPGSSGGTSEGEDGEGGGVSTALAGPARGGGGGGGSGGEAAPSESPLPAVPLVTGTSEPPPPAEEPLPVTPPPAAEEPQGPETTELKGTVVHANPAAGSYALAVKGGELVPVHARKLPRPGAKLTIEALQLANGTFAEADQPARTGKATEASFRGVVTFLDPDPAAPAYTVSGRGASLMVQVPADPTGVLPALPVIGARVTVTAALEPKSVLVQRQIEIEEGEPSTYLDLSGIYAGVSETGQLLLSADDTRTSETDLTLVVPPNIKTTKLKKGDSYLATAEVEPDGSLKLVGIASDEYTKGADNASLAQSDLKR